MSLPKPCPTRGSALVFALIVVAMVASAGAAYLQYVTLGSKQQVAYSDSIEAFYLAEAGLAESFHAVRMGRTGVIGSTAHPAQHGQGLLWVDAKQTGDDQIRLTSTAMVGHGRAALSYVVEPVEELVGFYSLEDLFLEDSILVDGYDSDEGPYVNQVEAAEAQRALEGVDGLDPLSAEAEAMLNLLTEELGLFGVIYELEYNLPDSVEYMSAVADLTSSQTEQLAEVFPDLREAYLAGQIDASSVKLKGCSCNICSRSTPELPPLSVQGPTTGTGGVMASSGDIIVRPSEGEIVEVFGKLIPGENSDVVGLDSMTAVEEAAPRAHTLEFPEIEVPSIPLQAAVVHDDFLPMEVVGGTFGYESIRVSADSDLILRGPVTLVIGELILEPGAQMEFDTRAGNVELFITEEAKLSPGSLITNSGSDPKKTSIQVAPISTFDEPPIDLDATGSFYGNIFAPQTEVRIGSQFEVFGGAVAKKLTIAPGARLHFDSAGFGNMSIPRLVSWRIVETPAQVKGSMGDPLQTLGIQRSDLQPLAQANDLTGVLITISYLGSDGVLRKYSGPESLFPWETVTEVVSVSRAPTWEKETDSIGPLGDVPSEPPPAEEAARTGVDPKVTGIVSAIEKFGVLTGGSATVFALKNLHPLTSEEWALLKPYQADFDAANWQKMVDADVAAGGTGGL